MNAVIWLPIPDWPGYEASDDGRIRTVDRRVYAERGGQPWSKFVKGRELKPRISGSKQEVNPRQKYLIVQPSRDGYQKPIYIHILVCQAFHGPRPSPDHVVRHLNGKNFDNRAENLKWGTKPENAQDTIRNGGNFNLNKTHCAKGHEFTEENTYYRKDRPGGRNCRECGRERARADYKKRPGHYIERALHYERLRRTRRQAA